jgi:protein-L-isoaspartate O-methyltransferase
LTLAVQPYLAEPNVVALRLIRARAGSLPMPLRPVIDRISQAAGAMHLPPSCFQWLQAGGDPVAKIRLPEYGDPTARIEAIELGDGWIELSGTVQSRQNLNSRPRPPP